MEDLTNDLNHVQVLQIVAVTYSYVSGGKRTKDKKTRESDDQHDSRRLVGVSILDACSVWAEPVCTQALYQVHSVHSLEKFILKYIVYAPSYIFEFE